MRFKKRLVLFAALLLATATHAGSAGQVKIKNINFMPQGVVIFYIEGTRSGAPSCGARQAICRLN